jgi:2-polyprenyl-3-methyl-5-hydroxy-6-metoxy-1,4-benzoquinol methylase
MVTGVDLVPENIFYVEKMANELSIKNNRFIESNILELTGKHKEEYDMVFST